MESKQSIKDYSTRELPAWQVAMMDTFVRATSLVGLPRSIGEIYGCLYCNPKPLSFDEIQDQLGICLLYTSPSPRDGLLSRMPSSA